MDCFIKKIFEGKSDEIVHVQFQKFSRGVFKDKALIKASRSAKGFSVATTADYANDLVRAMAEKLGSEKTPVTGPIVSTMKLKEMPAFQALLADCTIKQFAGVKQHMVNKELTGTELIHYLNAAPDAFFALSFTVGESILKIKEKAPKSAKPGTSESGPKIDFCSLKTPDELLVRSLLFDMPAQWKSIVANHTYTITDIELPANATTPEAMRRLATRKGTITRTLVIDGMQYVSTKEFVA